MSTRSFIGQRQPGGWYLFVYCHMSGQPEHLGTTILENYQDVRKTGQLIAHGSMSSLSEEVGPDDPADPEYERLGTIFHHRDHHEPWEHCLTQHAASLAEAAVLGNMNSSEYIYFQDDRTGAWGFMEQDPSYPEPRPYDRSSPENWEAYCLARTWLEPSPLTVEAIQDWVDANTKKRTGETPCPRTDPY